MKAIIAINNKGYIGKAGKLMWRSSEDFKHFKEKTRGSICIVGRKTYEEDLGGKDLPGRQMFVVGKNYNTLYDAVKSAILAQESCRPTGESPTKEIWVIGGSQIYKTLLPLIEEFHVSHINDDQEGDTSFALPDNYHGKVFNYNFEVNK